MWICITADERKGYRKFKTHGWSIASKKGWCFAKFVLNPPACFADGIVAATARAIATVAEVKLCLKLR